MIRDATEDDIEGVVDCMARFIVCTAYKHIEIDRDYCREMMTFSLNQNLLLVLECEGKVVGVLSALICSAFFSKKTLIVSEMVFWIDFEHRGEGTGRKMIARMEEKAKEAGATYLSMISMDASMPDKLDNLYLSMGYKINERAYSKEF